MQVYLARSKDLRREILNSVYDILATEDGPMDFRICDKYCRFEDDVLTWPRIFSEISSLRNSLNIDNDDFLILLTTKKNNNNWFSGWDDSGERSIFVHAAEWQSYFSCDEIYPIAYEVIANILQELLFDSIEAGVKSAHDPPIGCMNDMCSWKPNIIFKIRTADICDDCLEAIQNKGIDQKLVRQSLALFEKIRKMSLFCWNFNQNYQMLKSDFPFPIAITKRKLTAAIEPLRKFLMLLDHFDSMIRCAVIFGGNVLLKDSFHNFYKEQGLDIRPTLGDWVTALRKLVHLGQEGVVVMPIISREFINRINSVLNKAEDDKIVRLRNEKRGHGYCDCYDNNYQSLFLKYNPTISYIENQFYPMFIRLSCYYVLSMGRTQHNNFTFQVKNLCGDHPDFIEDTIETTIDKISDLPKISTVNIFDKKENVWYSLDPYITYCNCPVCQHNRVLIIDGESYLDPYLGHMVKLDSC